MPKQKIVIWMGSSSDIPFAHRIEDFVKETGSKRGQYILDNFTDSVGKFWLVKPKATKLESLMDDLQRRAA